MRSFYVISGTDNDYFALQLHGDELHFQRAIYALHNEKSVLGFYIEDMATKEQIYYWGGTVVDLETAKNEYGLPKSRACWYEEYLINELIVLKNGDIVPMDNHNCSLKEVFYLCPRGNNCCRKRARQLAKHSE